MHICLGIKLENKRKCIYYIQKNLNRKQGIKYNHYSLSLYSRSSIRFLLSADNQSSFSSTQISFHFKSFPVFINYCWFEVTPVDVKMKNDDRGYWVMGASEQGSRVTGFGFLEIDVLKAAVRPLHSAPRFSLASSLLPSCADAGPLSPVDLLIWKDWFPSLSVRHVSPFFVEPGQRLAAFVVSEAPWRLTPCYYRPPEIQNKWKQREKKKTTLLIILYQ